MRNLQNLTELRKKEPTDSKKTLLGNEIEPRPKLWPYSSLFTISFYDEQTLDQLHILFQTIVNEFDSTTPHLAEFFTSEFTNKAKARENAIPQIFDLMSIENKTPEDIRAINKLFDGNMKLSLPRADIAKAGLLNITNNSAIKFLENVENWKTLVQPTFSCTLPIVFDLQIKSAFHTNGIKQKDAQETYLKEAAKLVVALVHIQLIEHYYSGWNFKEIESKISSANSKMTPFLEYVSNRCTISPAPIYAALPNYIKNLVNLSYFAGTQKIFPTVTYTLELMSGEYMEIDAEKSKLEVKMVSFEEYLEHIKIYVINALCAKQKMTLPSPQKINSVILLESKLDQAYDKVMNSYNETIFVQFKQIIKAYMDEITAKKLDENFDYHSQGCMRFKNIENIDLNLLSFENKTKTAFDLNNPTQLQQMKLLACISEMKNNSDACEKKSPSYPVEESKSNRGKSVEPTRDRSVSQIPQNRGNRFQNQNQKTFDKPFEYRSRSPKPSKSPTFRNANEYDSGRGIGRGIGRGSRGRGRGRGNRGSGRDRDRDMDDN